MNLNLTKPLAFIDLETTGINVVRDRIVEIAILKVMPDGNIVDKTQRINPAIPIPAPASAIHGIYDKDVKDCPVFSQIAQEIIEFIDDSDLGGFNSIKFDIPLLMEECLRAGLDLSMDGRKLVDVQTIFHKMEKRNLTAAYQFYCDKALNNAHNAQADVTATYDILLAQLQRYNDLKNEMDFLHQLSMDNKIDFAGRMVYDNDGRERFNFGKHKGELVEDVLRRDTGYYSWIMKSEFAADTKKKLEIIWQRIDR